MAEKKDNSHALKMAEERDRTGKKPLTDEEYLAKHYALRDGAVILQEQCLKYAKTQGVAEAQKQEEHSARIIQNLKMKKGKKKR